MTIAHPMSKEELNKFSLEEQILIQKMFALPDGLKRSFIEKISTLIKLNKYPLFSNNMDPKTRDQKRKTLNYPSLRG